MPLALSLGRLFAPRPAVLSGRRLYAAAVAQARQPGLYEPLGAPDTPEGRFELYTLHVVLILRRLKRQGPQAAETAQGLPDTAERGTVCDDASLHGLAAEFVQRHADRPSVPHAGGHISIGAHVISPCRTASRPWAARALSVRTA